jgi:Domain of unknown function (DUF6285)
MNDHPTPLELIRIANQTLQSEVLPGAKPEHLYPLRMIANALGIAARELEAHDKDVADETRGLNLLYNDNKNFEALAARNRQFARDIRRGAFEAGAAQEAQLKQHLIVIARRKLAAAYPKGLQTDFKNSFKNK